MKFWSIIFILLLCGARLFAQGSGVNGEIAFRALLNSFPNKFGAVEFKNGDWTITAGDQVFYWAGGRILPEAEKGDADSYSPYSFYRIPSRPASPDTYTPQFIENMRRRNSGAVRLQRPDTHRGLQIVLYGGDDREQIEAILEQVTFLGKRIRVHRDIVPALRRVDAAIRRWNGAASFINSLDNVYGYNWRTIAGTRRMSYHSWGIAVDILPKNLNGKAIYWLWERDKNEDWMLIPLENRWNPPVQVIQAFEREGFIWGGNWAVFDNMHFEYRPELLEYTRLVTGGTGTAGASPSRDLHHLVPESLTLGIR